MDPILTRVDVFWFLEVDVRCLPGHAAVLAEQIGLTIAQDPSLALRSGAGDPVSGFTILSPESSDNARGVGLVRLGGFVCLVVIASVSSVNLLEGVAIVPPPYGHTTITLREWRTAAHASCDRPHAVFSWGSLAVGEKTGDWLIDSAADSPEMETFLFRDLVPFRLSAVLVAADRLQREIVTGVNARANRELGSYHIDEIVNEKLQALESQRGAMDEITRQTSVPPLSGGLHEWLEEEVGRLVAAGRRLVGKNDAVTPWGRAAGGRASVQALIMKGGGVKGLAIAGAVRELERYIEFETYVGTSAGAIAAILLASGANGSELERTLREKPFREFLDGRWWSYPYNLATHCGLHPGLALAEWLQGQVHGRVQRMQDVRLIDLPKRAVAYAAKLNASEVTFDGRGERKEEAAHKVGRASAAIPFFFAPESVDGRRAYDGGLVANYPVQLFLGQEQKRTGLQPSFVAIYLGSSKPEPLRRRFILWELLDIVLGRENAKQVDEYRSETLVVDTDPIGTTDFDLTELEKDFLLARGRAAALLFLSQKGILERSRGGEPDIAAAEAAHLHGRVVEARQLLRRSRLFRRALVVSFILAIAVGFGWGASRW